MRPGSQRGPGRLDQCPRLRRPVYGRADALVSRLEAGTDLLRRAPPGQGGPEWAGRAMTGATPYRDIRTQLILKTVIMDFFVVLGVEGATSTGQAATLLDRLMWTCATYGARRELGAS